MAWLWSPKFGLVRGLIVGTLLGALAAHLLRPVVLVAGLMHNPVWLLEGVAQQPWAAPLYQILSALLRAWGALVAPWLLGGG